MFTDKGFESFRKDVKNALAEVEKKYGVQLNLGNISYTSTSFTTKLEAVKVTGDKSAEQVKFEQDCVFYNLKPQDFGKEFTNNGNTYKLIGLNRKAPKFPILGTDPQTGKTYGFTRKVLETLK